MNEFDTLKSAATISLEVENALIERLGNNKKLLSKLILSGKITLASGAATISHGLITAKSVIVVTPETTNASNDIRGICVLGLATITSSSGADARVVNYIIIL